MVRRITLWICGMLLPLFAMSQAVIRESIGSVATTYSSDRFDMQACIGQPYGTTTVHASDHRPGFIQPQTLLITYSESVSIGLYPNPTSGELNFSLDKEMKNVNVVVMDLMGHVVYDENYETLTSGFADGSSWAAGMYFIRLQQNNKVLGTGKIIKVNNR